MRAGIPQAKGECPSVLNAQPHARSLGSPPAQVQLPLLGQPYARIRQRPLELVYAASPHGPSQRASGILRPDPEKPCWMEYSWTPQNPRTCVF